MGNARLRAVAGADQNRFGLRYATIHGHRHAYVCAGRGPALVMIHGIGDSSATWDALVPAFAEHFTVIAPDLLGHGGSDRPRGDYTLAASANGIRDLLGYLGIERATVVGHSLGGGIAMQLAYQFPHLCDRLVLVSSGGAGRDVHPVLRLAATPGAECVLPLLNNPLARLAGRVVTRVLGGLGIDFRLDAAEMFRTLESLPDRPSRNAFCRTLRSVVDSRGQVVTMLDRCYMAENVPAMLIWGAQDRVIPVRHAYAAAAAMSLPQLEVFADAAHFPHHTDPLRFVAVMTDFCGTNPPAAHDASAWQDRLRRGAAL